MSSARTTTDAMIPHSIEAEEAVLGSILINADCLGQVAGMVSPDDFFIERHGLLFGAMQSTKADGDPIDVITLATRLGGGVAQQMAFILGLINKTPNALNVEGYARTVKGLAVRRGLLAAASEIARLAHSETTDIEEVVVKAQTALDRPADGLASVTTRVADLKEVALQLMVESNERQKSPTDVWGIPTGFSALDRATGGIPEGELSIVTSRPGMGKSQLFLEFARRFATNGYPVLIFSMEDPAPIVVGRLAAQLAQVNATDAKRGRLTHDQKRAYDAALNRFMSNTDPLATSLHVDDGRGRTVAGMAAIAQRYQQRHGVKVVLVDTGNRIDVPNAPSVYERMSRAALDLAVWAGNSGLAVMAIVQQNRGSDGGRGVPTVSGLKGAGEWEEIARLILGLHRPIEDVPHDEREDKPADLHHRADVYVLKNNHGPSGGVARLVYNPGVGFAPVAPHSSLEAARARESTI